MRIFAPEPFRPPSRAKQLPQNTANTNVIAFTEEKKHKHDNDDDTTDHTTTNNTPKVPVDWPKESPNNLPICIPSTAADRQVSPAANTVAEEAAADEAATARDPHSQNGRRPLLMSVN